MLKFESNSKYKNEILKTDWGYISYNPGPVEADLPQFVQDLGRKVGLPAKIGIPETAVVVNGYSFYVLEGDFRKEYEEAINTCNDLEYCMLKVFLPNIDKKTVGSLNWGDIGSGKDIQDMVKEILKNIKPND